MKVFEGHDEKDTELWVSAEILQPFMVTFQHFNGQCSEWKQGRVSLLRKSVSEHAFSPSHFAKQAKAEHPKLLRDRKSLLKERISGLILLKFIQQKTEELWLHHTVLVSSQVQITVLWSFSFSAREIQKELTLKPNKNGCPISYPDVKTVTSWTNQKTQHLISHLPVVFVLNWCFSHPISVRVTLTIKRLCVYMNTYVYTAYTEKKM